MNRLLYRLMLAIAEHLDRINDREARPVTDEWGTHYVRPYPAARRALDS